MKSPFEQEKLYHKQTFSTASIYTVAVYYTLKYCMHDSPNFEETIVV